MTLRAVHGEHHDVFDTSGNEKVVKCTSCGHVYLNPQPDVRILRAFQAQRQFDPSEDISPSFAQLIHSDLDNIRAFKTGRKLLQIACRWLFLAEAQRRGFEVSGVDVNAKKCAFIRDTFNMQEIFAGDFGEISLADKSFDVIVMVDVLGRAARPRQLIRDVKRVLKDNGLIYLSTPNYGGISAATMRAKWPHLVTFGALHFFTDRSLERLLQAEGLVIKQRPLRRTGSFLRDLRSRLLGWGKVQNELCIVAMKGG